MENRKKEPTMRTRKNMDLSKIENIPLDELFRFYVHEAIRHVPASLTPWLYPEGSTNSPFCIANYKTEREWIDWVLSHYRDDEPRERFMMIRIDEENLAWLESASCEEVYEHYLLRYSTIYNMLPEMTELCSRYGDRENAKIYFLSELERKWVELYLDETRLRNDDRDAVWF